jgi:hypothetical protein
MGSNLRVKSLRLDTSPNFFEDGLPRPENRRSVRGSRTPSDLRGVAAQARDHGQLEIGRYLELIADYRKAETV